VIHSFFFFVSGRSPRMWIDKARDIWYHQSNNTMMRTSNGPIEPRESVVGVNRPRSTVKSPSEWKQPFPGGPVTDQEMEDTPK
jgi:hypothetical protein